MRTTIDLDEDILRAGKSLARQRSKSLGKVISELARIGMAAGSRSGESHWRGRTISIALLRTAGSRDIVPGGWVTCPMTQAGFVRVSSNPGSISAAVSPRDALDLLARMTRHADHRFWPDDVSLADLPAELRASLVGHRQVTDACLLSLAIAHQGTLATFDRGIMSLVPDLSPLREAIVVIKG